MFRNLTAWQLFWGIIMMWCAPTLLILTWMLLVDWWRDWRYRNGHWWDNQ